MSAEVPVKKRLVDYASCAGCAAKLPPQGIERILKHLPAFNNPNLLVGTETHDDAGVYRLTPELALVQTIDFFPPVLDDPFIYGQIAAANALSDIYAMGGIPITALNLLGYPDDQDPELTFLEGIFRGGADRMIKAGCVVLGGHTVRDHEIKFGYAVTGTVHPDRILINANAKAGDALILTKALGVGFINTAHKKEACPDPLFRAACASMVQLNDIGRDVALEFGAHSATDVTGFGLAGHSLEMAAGSNLTLIIDLKSLPIFAGAEEFARKPYRTRASGTNASYVADQLKIDAGADPVRLEFFYDPQTSGGMLISLPMDQAEAAVRKARALGAEATAIVGEVVPRRAKALLVK